MLSVQPVHLFGDLSQGLFKTTDSQLYEWPENEVLERSA